MVASGGGEHEWAWAGAWASQARAGPFPRGALHSAGRAGEALEAALGGHRLGRRREAGPSGCPRAAGGVCFASGFFSGNKRWISRQLGSAGGTADPWEARTLLGQVGWRPGAREQLPGLRVGTRVNFPRWGCRERHAEGVTRSLLLSPPRTQDSPRLRAAGHPALQLPPSVLSHCGFRLLLRAGVDWSLLPVLACDFRGLQSRQPFLSE